jgi:predicted acylesterase/phospholipase RssA
MAPSFFGFYGYFGTLAAWEHAMSLDDVHFLREQIKGVAGASAGAMAAVLLAAGVSPRTAATHCESLTLESYADPPGVLAAFQGHLFEQIMDDFIQQETAPGFSRQLQDGIFPVAVSGFDLKTFTGKILSRGSMAKAARASASFPLLFQPAVWEHEDGTTSFLIDGGIADPMGVAGLAALNASRIVNMVVGQFGETGAQGPSGMPGEVSEVVSISIQNLPKGGPWAMANGPRAVEAARLAMLASLDLPLYKGKEKGHYELHIDASEFVTLP